MTRSFGKIAPSGGCSTLQCEDGRRKPSEAAVDRAALPGGRPTSAPAAHSGSQDEGKPFLRSTRPSRSSTLAAGRPRLRTSCSRLDAEVLVWDAFSSAATRFRSRKSRRGSSPVALLRGEGEGGGPSGPSLSLSLPACLPFQMDRAPSWGYPVSSPGDAISQKHVVKQDEPDVRDPEEGSPTEFANRKEHARKSGMFHKASTLTPVPPGSPSALRASN